MQEITAPLRQAIESGRVVLGVRQCARALREKEAKLIIIANNCPDEYLRSQKEVPVQEFPGSNVELGAACGKPFSVSVVAVLDPGKSSILNL
ncbi:MAG: 50S ribosomal protein L30e [Thermoplasmata archaeon]